MKAPGVSKLILVSMFTLSASAFADDKINWTGSYIGGNLGYGWGEQKLNNAIFPDLFLGASGEQLVTNPKPSMRSAFGGIQAGYNFMPNDKFLLGFDASILLGSFNSNYVTSAGLLGNFTANAKLDWVSTFKAKAGTFVGDTLVYVDGGVAIGNEKFKLNSGLGSSHFLSNDSETLTGWVLGFGIEQPIYKNITAGVDYQHIQFGEKNFGIKNVDPVTGSMIVNGANKLDILNIKLNYHF